MAIGVTAEDMPDLVYSTLNEIHKNRWIGEMVDIQEHVGFNDLCKNKKVRLNKSRGDRVRIITDHNNSAETDKLFGTVEFFDDDAVEEGTVPWRHMKAHMTFDTRAENMNSGPEAMFDAVTMKDARMVTSMVEECEKHVWGKPATSADDETPWGLKYWIVQNATTGFNGGNPAGFAAGRAGISSGDYARHKNWTATYTSYGDEDAAGLVRLMEQAADDCTWIAPAPEPGMGRTGFNKVIYMDRNTKYELKNVTKTNNDSLGFDLSTPNPVFRGGAITSVPYLGQEEDNHPVYMIDLNTLYAIFLKDWYMKRFDIGMLPYQPTCFAVVLYMTFNFVCHDLRKQAVLYFSG